MSAKEDMMALGDRSGTLLASRLSNPPPHTHSHLLCPLHRVPLGRVSPRPWAGLAASRPSNPPVSTLRSAGVEADVGSHQLFKSGAENSGSGPHARKPPLLPPEPSPSPETGFMDTLPSKSQNGLPFGNAAE